jgi:ParB/RepB/Spo0J family partition protein
MAGERALVLVAISQIDSSPFQTRTDFEANVKVLADSIREVGLITPVLLRPKPVDAGQAPSAGQRYELICGECRVRAAKELGWTEIRAVVEEMSDAEAALRVMVENETRADINMIEKARGYRGLLGPPANLSQVELSKRLGHADSTYVSRILALLDQPEEIQALVARGQLSEHHVRMLSRISDVKKRLSLASKAAAENWSVPQLTKVLKKRTRPRAKAGDESDRTPADETSDYSGFRLRVRGDEIVIACRNFRIGYDLPEQYALNLKGALVSFLRYEVAELQRARGEPVSPDAPTDVQPITPQTIVAAAYLH